jgi:GNAT superfamily N-acetyltransferase
MNTETDDTRTLAVEADRIEARTWTDWFAGIPPELRSEFGFGVRTVADATLFMAPRIPLTLLNRAVGLGMTRPASTADLDTMVQTFVDAGCSTFGLAWGPYAEPTTLVPHLDAMFPTPSQRTLWAKMVRGTVPPSSLASDLRIVAVDRSLVGETDRALARAHGAPFLAGVFAPLFWRPRWHLYAAMDRDVVVGGAALFLEGHTAWLGMGGVLPEYRRRGGQRSLMVQRIRDAIAAGATRIFTETGEPSQAGANPSLNNMERCGFQKIVSRTQFIGPPCAPGDRS